jgi:F-type H+-transporting ATPase subunit b
MVSSAYQLTDAESRELEQAVMTLTGANTRLRFEQRAELLAGVRLTLGGWVLGANLEDELRAFTELSHD